MRNIIFFVKYPQPGKVKTRLAASVGESFATEIYRCFVADLLERLEMLDARIFVFFGGNTDGEGMRTWLKKDFPLIPQKGADLGERMFDAFDHVFRAGHERSLIIGSDSPDLPSHVYEEAFDRLNESDMVIGPAADGGYYLMGLHGTSLDKRLFQDISWSSGYVLSQTLEKARHLEYKFHLLPEWEDVDTPKNLLNLYERNQTGSFCRSQTMLLLRRHQSMMDDLSRIL